MNTAVPLDRRTRLALIGLVASAFALRLACAQGGLWLDEAWSAVLAHEVGTPAGVLFGINHDNNHHLNSLWLQMVGLAAPSWLMRIPSILAGTLAVPVAAALALPRGRTTAIVTALLFAASPILVTLGSEARGYAPMTLTLLVACLFVDRTLAGDERYRRSRPLALCFALGALAQLTMVFGVLALCGWAFVTWWRRESFRAALRRSVALFGAPLIALAAVLALVAGAAWASPAGFRFGSYDPFTFHAFSSALVDMVGYTIGLPVQTVLLPGAAVVLVVLAPRWGATRTSLYGLAIIAFPLMLAVLQSGNPGYPRYYLLSAIALLLLIGEVIGRALATQGRARWIAAAALGAITLGSMVQNLELATDRRGDPAEAVRMLAALAPDGSTIALDRETGRALLMVAAAQQGYALRFATHPCPALPFVFADRSRGEAPPPFFKRCGITYTPVVMAEPQGLSGTPWTLYRRPF
jgi:uncharacterized membrane protein